MYVCGWGCVGSTKRITRLYCHYINSVVLDYIVGSGVDLDGTEITM